MDTQDAYGQVSTHKTHIGGRARKITEPRQMKKQDLPTRQRNCSRRSLPDHLAPRNDNEHKRGRGQRGRSGRSLGRRGRRSKFLQEQPKEENATAMMNEPTTGARPRQGNDRFTSGGPRNHSKTERPDMLGGGGGSSNLECTLDALWRDQPDWRTPARPQCSAQGRSGMDMGTDFPSRSSDASNAGGSSGSKSTSLSSSSAMPSCLPSPR